MNDDKEPVLTVVMEFDVFPVLLLFCIVYVFLMCEKAKGQASCQDSVLLFVCYLLIRTLLGSLVGCLTAGVDRRRPSLWRRQHWQASS